MYHDEMKDRRRKLGTYRSERCQNMIKQKRKPCIVGDTCPYSHNTVEEFYHPEKYKAKFCESFLGKNQQCDYGEFCAFAHADQELSIDLIKLYEQDSDFYMFHFKTAWCPYEEKDHQRELCVYAHNWQDFRRKPH